MFSFISLGGRVRPVCSARKRTCPLCGESVSLAVIRHFLTPRLFGFSTVPVKVRYTAVCPRCAGSFALRPQRGRQLEADPDTIIGNGDLKPRGSSGTAGKS